MAVNVTELAQAITEAGIPLISVRCIPPELAPGWAEDMAIVYGEDATVAQINKGEQILRELKAKNTTPPKWPMLPMGNLEESRED